MPREGHGWDWAPTPPSATGIETPTACSLYSASPMSEPMFTLMPGPIVELRLIALT